MEEEDLINQFTSVTSAPRHLAEQYLARNDNNLIESIEDYYANAQTATGGGSRSTSGGEAKKSSQRYVYMNEYGTREANRGTLRRKRG